MNKNPNMTEPLHNKIAQALLRTLQTGQWRKGQRLPTERDLAADMGCAVGTLRKALAQLENEGLLERVQGRGTFVARVPDGAEYPMFHLELRQGGGQPAAKVIERNLRPCPVGLNNPQHLRRVRYLDSAKPSFSARARGRRVIPNLGKTLRIMDSPSPGPHQCGGILYRCSHRDVRPCRFYRA